MKDFIANLFRFYQNLLSVGVTILFSLPGLMAGAYVLGLVSRWVWELFKIGFN